jgi:hypothetical protein
MAGVSLRASQTAAPQATSTVEGRVLHDPGGEPIRKVVVRLLDMTADSATFISRATENSTDQSEAIEAFTSLAAGAGVDEEQKSYEAATDAEGHFKCEKVPPGNYLVSISRDGYVAAETKPRGMVITVVEGQNLADLTYKMASAGLIAGKIVDADGDPMSGLTVQAIPKATAYSPTAGALSTYLSIAGAVANLPGIATTNDLGEYRVAGLPAGEYMVIARPHGNVVSPPTPANKARPGERLLYAPTYFPGVFEGKQATPLQVTSGSVATADFTLLVHRAYRVGGIISGLGNTKHSFIILIANNGRPQQQPLGDGGKFEFPSLEPGTYYAQVMELSDGSQQDGPTMMTVPTPIVVSNSDIPDLMLQPLANGKVSGKFRVEGQDKVDWKELTVTLMHVPDPGESADKGLFNLLQQGRSGNLLEDGTFELGDVVPGNYQLVVGAPSEKYRDWYLKSALFAGREVADIGFASNGDPVLDVLVSPKGAAIEGKVVDATGKPAANVSVVAFPSSGSLGRPDSYQTAKTDAQGSFLMRGLNPTDFTVVALESFEGDARTTEFYQKYRRSGTGVSLSEGEKKTVTLTLTMDENKR